MKRSKMMYRAALFCGATMVGLFACQKIDNSTSTAVLSENTLKAVAQTYTAEVFDEVMEIGDETLSLYENLLHGKDSLGHDSVGGRGGHHGMGGPGDRDSIDHIWHPGDSLRIGDLDSLCGDRGAGDGHLRLGSCTRISSDWSGDTLITTINYGTDSCVSFDGKVRKGKIIMTSIGDYFGGDAVVTFRCEDYYVDNNQVLGTSNVTTKINADGNRESLIKEEGSIVLADGSGTILWSSEKTRIVKAGTDTTEKMDDVIEVTGTASGTLASGNTFTSQTQTPLVRNHLKDCLGVYVSGITNINVSDGTVIVVDYGDGTCDNLATVTIDGVSETITLTSFMPGPGKGGKGGKGGHGKGHGGGH